jgi:hypothetical protein
MLVERVGGVGGGWGPGNMGWRLSWMVGGLGFGGGGVELGIKGSRFGIQAGWLKT